MIISDTDFLSSFAKIGRVNLIFEVLKVKEITITNAVYEELKKSSFFENLHPYFSDGNKNRIRIEKESEAERIEKFGLGETESINLAVQKKAKLLMDDRAAGKYAESKGIDVIDIPAFLFYCKEKKRLNSSEIKEIISDLKSNDYYEFESGSGDFY